MEKRRGGIVQEILTNSLFHPHGIKVVGRIANIVSAPSYEDNEKGFNQTTLVLISGNSLFLKRQKKVQGIPQSTIL
jgi:hypothetical protein